MWDAQYLPSLRQCSFLNSASQLGQAHVTNEGLNLISPKIGPTNSPMFFKKRIEPSLAYEYQYSTSTIFVFWGKLNSMLRTIYLISVTFAVFMKSFKIYPSLFPIRTDGMPIPRPVPSSDITTLSIFSFLVSIMMATLPPALAIFLVLVTKWQSPRSTIMTGASSGPAASNFETRLSSLLHPVE